MGVGGRWGAAGPEMLAGLRQTPLQRSMKKVIELSSLQESFTEHDLRAKVSSDIDSEFDAQKLLQHADVATTRKHYRRKGSITAPADGFSVIPTKK